MNNLVESFNVQLRQSVPALWRRTKAFAKTAAALQAHLDMVLLQRGFLQPVKLG